MKIINHYPTIIHEEIKKISPSSILPVTTNKTLIMYIKIRNCKIISFFKYKYKYIYIQASRFN